MSQLHNGKDSGSDGPGYVRCHNCINKPQIEIKRREEYYEIAQKLWGLDYDIKNECLFLENRALVSPMSLVIGK